MPFVSVRRICSEFETISKNILKVPESTEDMAQITDHIGFSKTKGIEELNERIKVNNLMMLLYLTPKHIELSYTYSNLIYCLVF